MSVKNRAIAAVILGALFAWAGAAEAEIRFHASCQAEGERLRLGELGDITAADPAVRDKLVPYDLGYSPQPSASRSLLVDPIVKKIEAETGISLKVSGSPRVNVSRPDAGLDLVKLKAELRAWLAAQWKVRPEDIETLEISVPHGVRPPSPDQRFAFRETGSAYTSVLCTVGSGDYRKEARLGLRFRVWTEVAVSTAKVEFGTVLSPTESTFERRLLERSPWDYVRSPSQLAFLSAKALILPGEPIFLEGLREENAVRRGDPVSLTFHGTLVSVKTGGKAMQAGKVGEYIRVRNESSGRIVLGRVVSRSEVQVEGVR